MNKVKESKAIKMRQRAEGRQKVHPKVTRTAFHYLLSGSGVLKTLRLCFVLGAAISFIIAPAHESYIAILLLECCIVLSFIIIYVLGLHHLLLCILWPIFACCFTAAGVCILEVACQGGRLWYNKWKTAVKDNRLAGKDMKKETSDTTGEKAVAEERGAMAMRK
uniref:Uncharacterized protein LOC110210464 isoform X2 n=1 Tax=Phascolarctos cinereus TaxID=38626 RepID=A0A6P5KKH7_PHACI|nr:uncharacterized protein LOC110210464 isoform X2 [Phascolarctos cinereus]